jgi:hypothetical protein
VKSTPEIFYDPEVAAGRPHKPRKGERRGRPKAPPNPARIAADILAKFDTIPGWPEFQLACSVLAQLASTPGWEDAETKKTHPGAHAIGLAQWGAAIATAGTLADAVHAARWPDPGIDPTGFIWLNWRAGDSEFSLELHANILHQAYKWRRIVDGMPREHESRDLCDVVQALRTFVESTKRKP